jgi:hypothetical protein
MFETPITENKFYPFDHNNQAKTTANITSNISLVNRDLSNDLQKILLH